MRILGVGATMILAMLGIGCAPAWADGTPQQQNLTQREYNQTVATKTPQGETPETVLPVHDLSKSNARDVRQAGGRKVIEGGVWKNETPEEREQHLKNLPHPEGTVFMIEVPSGNVWIIPVGDQNATINDLIRTHVIDMWDPYEIIGLPVAVGNGPTSGDRPARGERIALAISLKF
jgi:hypothetical protein